MKLTDLEKSQLKLLYHNGYRYLARDYYGLCAYRKKPVLYISKAKDYPFRCWSPETISNEFVCFMHADDFLDVGFHETEPYMITEDAKLKLCKPTKKEPALWR